MASGPGETILGDELNNPYALGNINQANGLIGGSTAKLLPTHYYLKFIPASGEEVFLLEEFAEAYDYEFEAQPIHYEVLYEGDEGYAGLAPDAEGFVPEYGAVSAEDYDNGNLPDVAFEVIDIMHIPPYESLLTFTAFVISGNEKNYEAIDGYCHPDCPAWPACLDAPEFTCDPPGSPYLETVDPTKEESRVNFPDYLLDDRMGYYGEYKSLQRCDAIVNAKPSCPANCSPVLVPLDHEPEACRWECQCETVVDDGGSTTPPGLVEACGCLVFRDERKPGGRIILEDTQLGDEGVRRAKVMTTRYHWGFIWKNTDTDDNGCWRINKRYNVRKAKTKVVFRDRTSKRFIIRSLRGWRIWNAFIKPVKQKFTLTRQDQIWNNQCLRIEESDKEQDRKAQTFIAATNNNAIHEYYSFEGLPEVKKLNVLIHTGPTSWQAAPMFGKSDDSTISPTEIGIMLTGWLPGIAFEAVEILRGGSLKPDLLLPYRRSDDIDLARTDDYRSDDIKELAYHEMSHVSQFSRFGSAWWKDYRQYIFTVSVPFNGQGGCRPYGNGSIAGSGLAEVAEGMAVAISQYYADLRYGENHSNNDGQSPNAITVGRFLNKAEQLDFWRDPPCGKFIPEGLFFDLFDENDVFPEGL